MFFFCSSRIPRGQNNENQAPKKLAIFTNHHREFIIVGKIVLGHTKLILWMTDSQQIKMEQDFFFIFFISYKNGESEEATIFPAKMGRAKKRFFFKERNVTLT